MLLYVEKKTHYENDTFDVDNKLVPSKNSNLPHSNLFLDNYFIKRWKLNVQYLCNFNHVNVVYTSHIINVVCAYT